MDWNEFQASRKFIEAKALQLMEHENKPDARTGFPPQNYREYKKNGRTFYYVGTNIFKGVFEDDLVIAAQNYPQKFGTGNAIDVIEGINEVSKLFNNIDDVIHILSHECFSLVVEIANGEVVDRTLRLDLFRKLDAVVNKPNQFTFTGGFLHALKHFSYNGFFLSTGRQVHNLRYTIQLLEMIIDTFFLGNGTWDKNDYVCLFDYDDRFDIKLVFYHEKNTDVYFLKTIHQQPKPPKMQASAGTIY